MEWLGMQNPDWQKMLLTLVAVIAGLILAISGLLMLRYRVPQKDEAARLYARFVKKTGLQPGVGETPLHFAARARQASTLPLPTIEAITNAYLDARYGPTSGAAFVRLKTAVSAIT
jgi:hypothetical protein